MNIDFGYIPVLSSEAGSCLTPANWKELGIKTASYTLESLLVKPGLELLNQIHNLKDYLGWSGALILNASALEVNKAGVYVLRSPFDGTKITFEPIECIRLINHLMPDAVLLPNKMVNDCPDNWVDLNEAIIPFIHAEDRSQQPILRPHGIYDTKDTCPKNEG
ncbi:MAG: hypothetical protein ACHP6H_07250, partial [Legionellales bacterium]